MPAAIALLAGCAASAEGSSGGDDGENVLRWANYLPSSWDPVTSTNGYDIHDLSLVYGSLTQLDSEGQVQPGLASEWSFSDDGLTLTVTLRPDLTFQDGSDVDAAAVAAFYSRALGAESRIADQLASIASVEAADPTHAVFHLDYPDHQLPYIFAGRAGSITSQQAAEADATALQTWPVGAGPFEITEFVPDSHAVFTKFDGYWDADDIHIDRFELSTPGDPSTVVAAVQSGSIDVATLPTAKVDEAKSSGLTVDIADSFAVSGIALNVNRAPLDQAPVQEALQYAIDRDAYIDVVLNGYGSPIRQPFAPGYVAYSDALDAELAERYPYDPERAKKVLQDAGIAPGSVSLEISTTTSQGAEFFQNELDAIGIDSTIDVVNQTEWASSVYANKDAALTAGDGNIGRESPVQELLTNYGPTALNNLSAPQTAPAFAAALERVRQTPIESAGYADALHDAVKTAVTGSPWWIWVANTPRIWVTSNTVSELNTLPTSLRWEGVTVG
jgi:peptide/nickel transport system substrate-binding protein